ncbi:MAG: ArsR/SmtB family transcription factor [Cellulosilyticaceae bacterium]
MMEHDVLAKTLKALSDSSRLKIVEILSEGESCACTILESFDFTQPTLSHHMKILMECGIVVSRKEGIWSMYTLNMTTANRTIVALMDIITANQPCSKSKEEKSNE